MSVRCMARWSWTQTEIIRSKQVTSSVETAMKRRMPPYTRQASRSTCVPYVLFMVKAKLLPKELSTWVCA